MRQLQEVQNLSHSERQLLQQLKSIIVRFVPEATILLYGSAARGARAADSDYDILVITPMALSSKEEDRIQVEVYALCLANNVVLSVMFATVEEWNSPLLRVSPYHRNVEREGVLI